MVPINRVRIAVVGAAGRGSRRDGMVLGMSDQTLPAPYDELRAALHEILGITVQPVFSPTPDRDRIAEICVEMLERSAEPVRTGGRGPVLTPADLRAHPGLSIRFGPRRRHLVLISWEANEAADD